VVLAIAGKAGFGRLRWGLRQGTSMAESPRRTQSRKRLRAIHRPAVTLRRGWLRSWQVVTALTVAPSEVGDAGNGYPTPHKKVVCCSRASVRAGMRWLLGGTEDASLRLGSKTIERMLVTFSRLHWLTRSTFLAGSEMRLRIKGVTEQRFVWGVRSP